MIIEARKGNIVQIAPGIADAVALWIRDGYSNSAATWIFDIRENWNPKSRVLITDRPRTHNPRQFQQSISLLEDLNEFDDGNNELYKPWFLPMDSLFELSVPDSNLKYAYMFSHLRNNGYVEEQRAAIWRCLDQLSRRNVKKIAFLQMPFARGAKLGETHVRSDVAMLSALREWAKINAPSPVTHVYLVDFTDDFFKLLQNESQQ
jgi:hypothetical protein